MKTSRPTLAGGARLLVLGVLQSALWLWFSTITKDHHAFVFRQTTIGLMGYATVIDHVDATGQIVRRQCSASPTRLCCTGFLAAASLLILPRLRSRVLRFLEDDVAARLVSHR